MEWEGFWLICIFAGEESHLYRYLRALLSALNMVYSSFHARYTDRTRLAVRVSR